MRKFVGSGGFRFAAVPERFLGLYTTSNSFTKLIARTTRGEGPMKSWPTRAGDQQVVSPLVLKAEQVPEFRLTGDGTFEARPGCNTWLLIRCAAADAIDVVLEREEVIVLGGNRLFEERVGLA
jgi:hypothetical protein